MFKIKQCFLCFAAVTTLCFNFSFNELQAYFVSPSLKQQDVMSITKTKTLLELRKVPDFSKTNLKKITADEKEGFLGYHGDSLEFYIYQDIIRLVIEEIVHIPIRKDFHFLTTPLAPALSIEKKEDLIKIFTSHEKPSLALFETTFSLNFSLWDNANRLGLNSIEQFAKNESVKPLGYKRRLKWLFAYLEIPEKAIDQLFEVANKKLFSATGVILQFFDSSKEPYAFSKLVAYPAYPNGFICENRTIDEFFMNENFIPPYPHELRLLLNNKQTLNPTNPLKIVRHLFNLSKTQIGEYENQLRNEIKKLSYSKKEANRYREKLEASWSAK